MPKLAHRVTMPRPGDPRIIVAYADAIRDGHPLVTAATLAGISEATARLWLQHGIEEDDAYTATQDTDSDAYDADAVPGSHVAFARAVREAEADSVGRHLSVFGEISNKPGHWQRSAWFLERKHADTFGLRQHTTLEQTVNVRHTITASLGPAQRAALAALLTDDNSTPDVPLLPAPADTNTDA